MKKSKSIEFYMKELEILHEISSVAGARVDFVQGGGGNTSVKLDGELMAVKASGFKLNQVTAAEGYAIVNYKKIAGYFTNVDPQSGIDYEVDCNDFIRKNTVSFEGLKELRPSVEAGFHSILGKCVLHTHSVYANLLCCTEGGQELAAKLFNGAGFTWIWVPYINPGFSLSMEILKASGASVRSGMGFPTVVLMENHGLVVSSQDAAGCNLLNEKVNNLIKEYFGIKESFPSVLLKDNYGDLQGRTGYILEYIKKGAMNENYLDKY
ncbi:MAG: class II aldolase/adducin family protein, partial [Clostridiales bacterium]|nr:class II aldolase/adducin family protein [Clostridiales bacterium]